MAPCERASLLGSQFNSKLCCEQFVTPLSCFLSLGVRNSFTFRISVLLCLLFDFDIYGGVDPLAVSSFSK